MKIKPKTFLPEIFLKKIKNVKINEKSEENDLKKIQKDVNEEIKKKQKENEIKNKLKKHKILNNTLDLMKEDIEKIDDLVRNNANSMSIELEFNSNGRDYKIIREKKSNLKSSKKYYGKNYQMISELKKELSMANKFIEYFA